MKTIDILEAAASDRWSDLQVIDRVKAGETGLYEIIMRRYNQRIYRVARAILRDEDEAEDVMQDSYVRAYQHLDQFSGEAPFSAWLTRIAVHEALHRVKLRKRYESLEATDQDQEGLMTPVETSPDPEQRASIAELSRLLEEAVLSLPDQYRAVVMMRDIEQLTTAETAAALDLTEQNVKVRLHRGHAMMQGWFLARIGEVGKSAFPFMAVRCDRVVAGVFSRLTETHASTQ